MPSFLFMKILESTPERYDRGLEILSRGRISEVYDTISEAVSKEGAETLDIGCGTGNLSLACAKKGSSVTGIDINSGMLEVSRRKAKDFHLKGKLEFMELGVAEIMSKFGENRFDACVSCLAFSELTEDEQSYAIMAIHHVLKPGGLMIIADEVAPQSFSRRVYRWILDLPMKLIAYILTQSTTRPLGDITQIVASTGFNIVRAERIWNDSFIIIKAEKGGGV